MSYIEKKISDIIKNISDFFHVDASGEKSLIWHNADFVCCRRYFFTTFFPFTIYIPRGSRPNGVVSLTPSGV